MSHKRRGGHAAGAHAKTAKAPKKKSGGLLIGMRGGMKRAVGQTPRRTPSSGPGAGGAGTLGRVWTVLTIILLLVGAVVLLVRRFAGP